MSARDSERPVSYDEEAGRSSGRWVLAAKQDPHRPSVSPAPGLRASVEACVALADRPCWMTTMRSPTYSAGHAPPWPAGPPRSAPDDVPTQSVSKADGEQGDLLVLFAAEVPPAAPGGDPHAAGPRLTAEEVFRCHVGRVFAVARGMLGNDADAEDVTSEVLLQVVRKLDTFRGEAALITWLYKVTANTALALRRKRAAHRERLPGGPPEWATGTGEATPDEQALRRELRQRIEAAIGRLPPLYRDAYVLADVDGLSNAEI